MWSYPSAKYSIRRVRPHRCIGAQRPSRWSSRGGALRIGLPEKASHGRSDIGTGRELKPDAGDHRLRLDGAPWHAASVGENSARCDHDVEQRRCADRIANACRCRRQSIIAFGIGCVKCPALGSTATAPISEPAKRNGAPRSALIRHSRVPSPSGRTALIQARSDVVG